jgi:hypothetical protein
MSQSVEKLAVLFADISGSTALYESRGDEVARRLIAQCIAVMLREVQTHRGALIKTIGDEIMCTFGSAEDAFKAACGMQNAVEKGRFDDGVLMHIRVGFHYGDVIREEGDVFGDTVNVAARVAAITRASQIMTTQAVVDALSPESREKTRQIMRAEFRGKQEQFDISLVVWEMDDMMSTRIGTPAFRKVPDNFDELLLRFRDQELRVNKERRCVVLGRGDACDLVVMNNFASRQHLRIELRFGKLVAVDQSTNGTYFRFDDGHVTRAAREEITLYGKGSLSLGQIFADNTADLVEFSVSSHRAPSA